MNLAEYTPELSPLLIKAAEMAEDILTNAWRIEGMVGDPFMLLFKNGEATCGRFENFTPQTKGAAYAVVQQQRQTHDVVAFLCEAWVSTYKREELKGLRAPVEPRLDPKHQDALLAVLYEGNRIVQLRCLITHPEGQPPALADWEIVNDTARGQFATGRFYSTPQSN